MSLTQNISDEAVLGFITKFICSCCGDEFDISEIKKGTLTSIGTGKSKKCHNESQRLYQTLKLANKKPHKYKQCDDCDGVFAICNRNKFLNHCRFCKSTNIEQYHP